MSFAKDNRRRFHPGPARFVLPPFVMSPMMRVVALAIASILAATWAVANHAAPMPPMSVPVAPKPAPTYDADAGEIPVPDFYLGDGG